MNKYRTTIVKLMARGMPCRILVLLFLPYYTFKYGSINNGLDRIIFELEEELEDLRRRKSEDSNRTGNGES